MNYYNYTEICSPSSDSFAVITATILFARMASTLLSTADRDAAGPRPVPFGP